MDPPTQRVLSRGSYGTVLRVAKARLQYVLTLLQEKAPSVLWALRAHVHAYVAESARAHGYFLS